MSDLAWRLRQQQQQLGQTIVGDSPGIRLPYAPRVLNPFPLASAPGITGDFPQSRAVVLLALYVSVIVLVTNNGGNYWTINLIDTAAGVLATVNTSAIGAGVWTRVAASSLTQPGSTNVVLSVQATVGAGAPGAIYIVPEVVVG